MRILIVHPEGNINNNPNLFALTEVLSENGYKIDILSQKYSEKYQSESEFFNVFLLTKFSFLIGASKNKNFRTWFLRLFLKFVGRRYALIIGVDRDGIIAGSLISQVSNAPLAYISYEIFFKVEIGDEAKQEEVDACRDILFAICQDDLRATKLAEENEIPLEKIICIPVAGHSSVENQTETNYFRDEFGIKPEKKIALYMGSIDDWAGASRILDDLHRWPENWVLVLHGRYSGDEQYAIVEKLPKRASEHLYVSKKPLETFSELYQLPLSADIGIAMYVPDFKNPCTGNNLKYLGWASGKISTYFQCGLPVIVNDIGLISDAVKKYDLGHVVKNAENISDVLKEIDCLSISKKKDHCRRFFLKNLDFNLYKKDVLEAFGKSIRRDIKYFFIPLGMLLAFMNTYFFLCLCKHRLIQQKDT